MVTRLLVDADPLVYALAFVAAKDPDTDERSFVWRIGWAIDNYLQAAPDQDMTSELYLTDGAKNFRKDIATYAPYKGNRNPEKPFHYDMVRKVMMDSYGAHMSYEEEADDRIAIEMTADPTAIACSVDKDFLTVPGRLLKISPKGRQHSYIETDERAALQFFYCQILAGDDVDNIIGLFDMGLGGAFDYIRGCTNELEMYDVVTRVYETDLGYDEDYVIENARLLHLRRTEGEIWQPPYKRTT